jgi:transporter family protein
MMDRWFWLLFALVTWGLANFLMKIVGVRIDAASAVFGIVTGYAIVGITTAVLDGGRLALNAGFAWAMLVGGFYILGNWAYVRLARTEDLSTIAPIAGLNITIPIILGFLMLGEPLTIRKLLGILFALVAVVLLQARA